MCYHQQVNFRGFTGQAFFLEDSANRVPRLAATKMPIDAVGAHDAGCSLANVTLAHVAPWYQREIPRPIDQRVRAAFEVDAASDHALNALPNLSGLETLAELPGKPTTRLLQLELPEAFESALSHPESRPVAVGQLLLDEPLAAGYEYRPYLAVKAGVARSVGAPVSSSRLSQVGASLAINSAIGDGERIESVTSRSRCCRWAKVSAWARWSCGIDQPPSAVRSGPAPARRPASSRRSWLAAQASLAFGSCHR